MSGGTFAAGGFGNPTHNAHGAPPEYVKFHPSDSGFGLDPVFWKRERSPISASAGFDEADESSAV